MARGSRSDWFIIRLVIIVIFIIQNYGSAERRNNINVNMENIFMNISKNNDNRDHSIKNGTKGTNLKVSKMPFKRENKPDIKYSLDIKGYSSDTYANDLHRALPIQKAPTYSRCQLKYPNNNNQNTRTQFTEYFTVAKPEEPVIARVEYPPNHKYQLPDYVPPLQFDSTSSNMGYPPPPWPFGFPNMIFAQEGLPYLHPHLPTGYPPNGFQYQTQSNHFKYPDFSPKKKMPHDHNPDCSRSNIIPNNKCQKEVYNDENLEPVFPKISNVPIKKECYR